MIGEVRLGDGGLLAPVGLNDNAEDIGRPLEVGEDVLVLIVAVGLRRGGDGTLLGLRTAANRVVE